MLYTELTVKAMNIAFAAHAGQLDKGGMPYIFHPYHIAEQMKNEAEVCAALLHDVVEDTDVTFSDLEKEFPAPVVNAVRLLTHDEGVPYEEYLLRIKSDPIALAVKLADIAHNSDQSRLALSGITESRKAQLREKYRRALDILSGK